MNGQFMRQNVYQRQTLDVNLGVQHPTSKIIGLVSLKFKMNSLKKI